MKLRRQKANHQNL